MRFMPAMLFFTAALVSTNASATDAHGSPASAPPPPTDAHGSPALTQEAQHSSLMAFIDELLGSVAFWDGTKMNYGDD